MSSENCLKLKAVTWTQMSGLCYVVEVAYGTKWYTCEYTKVTVNAGSINLRCKNRGHGKDKWNCQAVVTVKFKRENDGSCVLQDNRCVYLTKQVGKKKFYDVDFSADKLHLLLDVDNYEQTLHYHTKKCQSSVSRDSGHCTSTNHDIKCYSEHNSQARIMRDFRHALKEKADDPENRTFKPSQPIQQVKIVNLVDQDTEPKRAPKRKISALSSEFISSWLTKSPGYPSQSTKFCGEPEKKRFKCCCVKSL